MDLKNLIWKYLRISGFSPFNFIAITDKFELYNIFLKFYRMFFCFFYFPTFTWIYWVLFITLFLLSTDLDFIHIFFWVNFIILDSNLIFSFSI